MKFAKLGAHALAALTAGSIIMTPILAEADTISDIEKIQQNAKTSEALKLQIKSDADKTPMEKLTDQEAVPMEEPEATPTEEPEVAPTEEPEAVPTEEPEAVPTEEPEAVPTEESEATPTEEPEAVPTEESEAVPTEEPEAVPTEEPEVTSTEEPETAPTEEPETTPTEEPEAVPMKKTEVTSTKKTESLPTETSIPTKIPTEAGKPEEKLENTSAVEHRTTAPVSADNSSYRSYGSGSGFANTFSTKRINLFNLTDRKPMRLTEDVVDYLNVREARNESGRVIGVLYPGSVCYDIDSFSDHEWTYVEAVDQYGNVIRGYVKSAYIEPADKDDKGNPKKVFRYVSESFNKAFWDNNLTTQPRLLSLKPDVSAERQEIIKYGKQFLGNPYVWGGESLTQGTDCSGFTQQVFGHFGISLPRCSYEQAEMGEPIPLDEAEPGDLVFYARDGVVYHVMIYIGNGQILHASSSTTGIIISNVNPERVCWCVNVLDQAGNGGSKGSTLVQTVNDMLQRKADREPQMIAGDQYHADARGTDLREKLEKAAGGDCAAQEEVITSVADAMKEEWKEYGIAPSVIAAEVIRNGWSFDFDLDTGIDELKDAVMDDLVMMTAASELLGAIEEEKDVDVQDPYASCVDYAIRLSEEHPDAVGLVWGPGIADEMTDNSEAAGEYKSIYDEYGLSEYDKDPMFSNSGSYVSSVDGTDYTQEDMDLIWAIVAQEDDTSYEGALAVISSAMNRADINYGGYGTTALAQLTADGQYCYSPKVSDPSLWQRRLNGNVPVDVMEAVEDCLTKGIRNNAYLNFRSSNRTGDYVQIGSNWYF